MSLRRSTFRLTMYIVWNNKKLVL